MYSLKLLQILVSISATAHIQLQLDDSFAYQEYVMYSLKLSISVTKYTTANSTYATVLPSSALQWNCRSNAGHVSMFSLAVYFASIRKLS